MQLKDLIRPKLLAKSKLYSVLTNFSSWYQNFNLVITLIYRFKKVSKPQARKIQKKQTKKQKPQPFLTTS